MTVTRRAALATPLLLLGAAASRAQTRWQMATPYPDGNFHTRNIREMVAEVEQATGGRLSIQVHSNASLLPMPQIKAGVQRGQVQMGEILLTAYANEDPFFDADAIPFLVSGFADAKRLAALQRPFVEQRLQRQGLSLLYTVAWPPAGFYTQVPLTSLEVLRGSRFRTFSPMTNRFAALIGASPVLVQQAEVAQAFATGIATAMVTSAQTGVDTAAWDYARVFTPATFSMTKNAVIVSRRALEGLPQDHRQALLAAAEKANERGWRWSEEAEEASVKRLAERGMQIGTVTDELRTQLAEINRVMTEEWIQRAGEDGRKLIEQFRAGA
ncbi:TRAP transporter substrate-binding protein [Crenalkalicoccus roseus]|uniref:TRAP transporter substrate-binding protein n=1 Tax=Crenalkalicoccus roseus TaxID=1485588 RepID=UPI0010810624|nr:TRAP transporter substrate-binding protein [Crenalkalicoccus roseus]